MRQIVKTAALLMAALALVTGCSTPARDADSLTVVVLPHPDDEFQVWSQIEHSDDANTVFVLLTRGEQTVFCDSDIGGGKWSEQCAHARLDSWLQFFRIMGGV